MAYPIGRRPNLPETVNKGELRKLRTLSSEVKETQFSEAETLRLQVEADWSSARGRERGVSVRARFILCYL